MKQFFQKIFGREEKSSKTTLDKSMKQEEPMTFDLSPEEFANDAKNKNSKLIDVRRPEEFNEGHIKNALLLPVQELSEKKIAALGVKKEDNILLYCRSGSRSGHALHMLQATGYKNVKHLDGGILAWQEKNLPVEK